VGLFGAEPGTWKYDVSKYFHRMRTEIKPTAHTVHYLKELSEESLWSRMSEVRWCSSPCAGSCLLAFDLVHTSKHGQRMQSVSEVDSANQLQGAISATAGLYALSPHTTLVLRSNTLILAYANTSPGQSLSLSPSLSLRLL
jgi:hypothetical protein